MKVLITGITGQDGIFLTHLLLKNYNKINIVGTTRSSLNSRFYKQIQIKEISKNQSLEIKQIDLMNYNEVSEFVKNFKPDFIYNFSGPSSVYESLYNKNIEIEIKTIFHNLTSSVINSRYFPNFFQASSSEMFGNNNIKGALVEESPFHPNSPYAKAKLKNHKLVKKFYKEYDWKIYSGIMFNHESEFRSDDYLFMKIINSAYKIKSGKLENVTIGSTEIIRDWSYAGDIVDGIHQLVTEGSHDSYVLGSGEGTKIGNVVKIVFDFFDLNYKNHLIIDDSLLRENDPISIISNPKRINKDVGWSSTLKVEEIIEKIIKFKFDF